MQLPPHPGYLVWNPARNYPRYPHATLSEASMEAKRLASEHAGEAFFVLAAAAVAFTPKVEPTFALVENQPSADADQIPF